MPKASPTVNGNFAFDIDRNTTIALLGVICQVSGRYSPEGYGVACYLTR